MHPINQLVDKTNNKNTLATPFRLPSTVTGAQTAIIEADIYNSQKYKKIDHLKTNSSFYTDDVFYKQDDKVQPPKENPNQQGGLLTLEAEDGITTYYSNEPVNLFAGTSSNTLSWSLSNLNISQVSIQPQPSSYPNVKVVQLRLKDPDSIEEPISFTVTVTDTATKKQGSVNLTLKPYQATVTPVDTLSVTTNTSSVASDGTANIKVNSANTPIQYELVLPEDLDISYFNVDTYYDSSSPGSTNIFIRCNSPELVKQDSKITLKATYNNTSGSSSYKLLKYVDKASVNATTNEAIITKHVDTYKDAYDVAKVASPDSNGPTGPFVVTLNVDGKDTQTQTVDDLETLKLKGVNVLFFSGFEYWFTNEENNYKTIDIKSSKPVDLRPKSYTSITPNNTTYDGKNTNTIYLAPNREAHRSDNTVKEAYKKRFNTNVVRLDQTQFEEPTRATVIVNDRYLYVDENFTNSPSNNFTSLLSKARSLLKVQDSYSLTAIYPAGNEPVKVEIILANKANPTKNQVQYPDNSLYYDEASNITTFSFEPYTPS